MTSLVDGSGDKGQRTAFEWDLQRDFHQWLLSGQLQGIVQVEPTDVGMGRADVMVVFGSAVNTGGHEAS
ncbi:hypothetical protein OH809_02550 [Streptomyces sp. NBC_00873]|uniref:hypothetical protein n=1 Tax=unclassified Streptomyces TaxID=2593676 RepID=UPI00386FF9AF|nr:hypothetical protein OH809_02550 [Streptomyces sp. NBC_00873]WTA49120.1 hypothetical protein OH821_41260 [Streptomyces sp. NBC_00842]